MLKVLDRIDPNKDQQPIVMALDEGFTKLSAVEMNRVLEECAFDGQRNISDQHVDVLADLMKRGQWQPKSQIDFAVLNGRHILLNGYHRGYAQVRSGKTIEWAIAIHRVKTEAEVKALYHAFDTNVRMRSPRDILRANQFGAEHGLSGDVALSLYAAVPYIASRFVVGQPRQRNLLVEKQADLRLQLATEYSKAAARYAACLDGLSAVRKRKLLTGAIMAVAAVTFRYQSERAWEFWTGVAQNDGLKRGDPRQALVMDMMTRKSAGAPSLAIAPSIIAWNAFLGERELRLIKITDGFRPIIDGTPFDGTPWNKAVGKK